MSDLIPIRDIAKFGVITDRDPYDLPVGAWSMGVNARFRNGKITHSPVFRDVLSLGTTDPRFLVSFSPTSGTDSTFIGYKNGRLYLATPSAETDYSIAGYVNSSSDAVWTSAHLADLLYVNREDRVPWYLPSGTSQFAAIPNWTSTWRAHLIRACNSALIAFNVTKGATNYPTGIQTSAFALSGAAPTSWDDTDPATNATFNILAEMEGSIVDAQTLHNDVYVYGINETWRMSFVGGTDIWDYKKVFDNRGAINANCSIEVQGKHYVFGLDDIWSHDGISASSISDGRVREFIYGAIDASKTDRCFVAHNPQLKEINFCFIGADNKTKFAPYDQSAQDGCNRQAVYNYAFDQWTFDDVPYCYSAARCNIDSTLTYASVTSTYATMGASYQDQAANNKKPLCYVGDVNSTYSLTTQLYAFDLYGTGSIVPFSVDTNATGPLFVERSGIDLDEIGKDIPDYDVISSIYPQGRLDSDADPITFTVGASDYFTQDVTYADDQTYDANTLYKLDFNIGGRYLALQITHDDYKSMALTGFDLDLRSYGSR